MVTAWPCGTSTLPPLFHAPDVAFGVRVPCSSLWPAAMTGTLALMALVEQFLTLMLMAGASADANVRAVAASNLAWASPSR